MELLLWRHGDAAETEAGGDGRPLTERGQRQARRVAAWLHLHAPADLRIISSPAQRCRDTAAAVGRAFVVDASIGPDGGMMDLIAASGWPQAPGAVLVVAHQPAIGRLAALLLAGAEADWTVKKGALWWFSNRVRRGETQTVLRTAVTPDLLRAHDLMADFEDALAS